MILYIMTPSGPSCNTSTTYQRSCCPSSMPCMRTPLQQSEPMGRFQTSFLSLAVFIRVVCWHPHCSTFILMWPYTWPWMGTDRRRRASSWPTYMILKLESLVTDLEYADDMVLLADDWSDLTTMLDSLSTCCNKLGLTISCKKTKTLAVLPPNSPDALSPVPIHLVH